MFVSRILAVLAAGATLAPAALSAAPVAAVTDGATVSRQVHVQTDDLNLASAAGAATLKQRIEHAATQACGVADLSNPNEFRDMTLCRQVALAEAKPQIDLAMARNTPRYASAKTSATPTPNTASGL